MDTNIEVRYRQWDQKLTKLEQDLEELMGSITDDEYTLKPFSDNIEEALEKLSQRTNEMRIELEDIIVDEEVEDFLENGNGIKVDIGK